MLGWWSGQRDRIPGVLLLGCPRGAAPTPGPTTVQGRREDSPGEGFGAL